MKKNFKMPGSGSETPIRVAIYVRVSTVYQIDKDSLPMMKQDLTSYCKYILNTDDFVIFEDAGYSGKNTDRPAYQKMMSQIRQGLFTHLLVWKIDRISRNLLDFANMYAELKDLGVTFVSKNEQFDTSTAIGMMSQEPWMRTMNDEEFIRQASSFILTQKLADKQYIYYENLAESLDPEILKNFFVSILDSIILKDGRPETVVFRNGLSHTFTYKDS